MIFCLEMFRQILPCFVENAPSPPFPICSQWRLQLDHSAWWLKVAVPRQGPFRLFSCMRLCFLSFFLFSIAGAHTLTTERRRGQAPPTPWGLAMLQSLLHSAGMWGALGTHPQCVFQFSVAGVRTAFGHVDPAP